MAINQSIFKEYDIRGRYPDEISDATAFALGLAFAKLIKGRKIVIGRDARTESEKAFWPLAAGLAKGGLKIFDLGICATPELFFAVGAKKFPGGVMVTASHSPQGQTGFKFCDEKGRVYGAASGSKRLAALAGKELAKLSQPIDARVPAKRIDYLSIATEYKKFALSFIKPSDVAGFKLSADASNGSGGRIAEVVLDALPLKYSPLNFRSGAKQPQHGPNPLLPENRLAVESQVKSKKLDLGIIFDGDADRAIFIDELGRFVEPYYINCLLAQIVLAVKPGITIVADARLNLGIAETIKKNGGRILVHRSGYANFIKTMTQKRLLFGCENSGHFVYNLSFKKAQQFVYGDALISVLLVLKYLKSNKLTLSQAVRPFKEAYAISGELNFKTDKFDRIAAAASRIFPGAELSRIDGLSATAADRSWFFNVRPSHTEPVIRLNIEAKKAAKVEELKSKIIKLI